MPKIATPNLDFKNLPQRVDRRTGADLVTRLFFPIAARTLEVWPVGWLLVNGRATCETRELLTVAKAKLDAAPTLTSTRRSVRNAADAQGDAK